MEKSYRKLMSITQHLKTWDGTTEAEAYLQNFDGGGRHWRRKLATYPMEAVVVVMEGMGGQALLGVDHPVTLSLFGKSFSTINCDDPVLGDLSSRSITHNE